MRRLRMVTTLAGELDAATIPRLQARMATGEFTPTELTTAYLHRIQALDPQLRAILRTDPAALTAARASDERHQAGAPLGPLDGIPVLLKDNIGAGVTTAGSRTLRTHQPADAFLVRKLKAAGAIVLGKANLSEWANFRSTAATSGWSALGGQTANPHVLDHNPAGSSSGSAAAVAAALAQVAIGTETDGSIVCPAGATGVVGLKPTLGLVSRTGVIPVSAEQDTAGPLARHVVDAALTLAVLRGHDPADPATQHIPPYTDEPVTLADRRLGLWRLAGVDQATDLVINQAIEALRTAGATVVEVDLPHQREISDGEFPCLLTEFRHDLDRYLAAHPPCPGGPRDLAHLVELNRADPIELTHFGQELFEQALAAPPRTDPGYRDRRARITALAREAIDQTLAAQQLDAIIAPSNAPAWRTDYPAGDDYRLSSGTPAAVAGYPNVSVPAGFAGPLPIGLSIFAGRWQDARVLAIAAAFEQVNPVRRAPLLLPGLAANDLGAAR
ncbi:amidase [Crossiella sp. SN42]|uniref:amidase n=1 Tax=Crossiella sp. SN42 TaxID=2944808 RepID=UPI00207CAC85|nr:amidase [Crossiella sp. SN42]MCO1582716.1 amidase [Crossiella sp. SN42]